MARMKFSAAVRISAGILCRSTGPDKRRWTIDVSDPSSGVHILSLDLTAEQFGECVGGFERQDIPCEMMEFDILTARLGKRHDVRSILVRVPPGKDRGMEVSYLRDTPQVQQMIAEGWRPDDIDPGDRWNSHRSVRADRSPYGVACYRVSFHRYVPHDHPPADPSEEALPEETPAQRRRRERKAREAT